jgi:hypothetical protein
MPRRLYYGGGTPDAGLGRGDAAGEATLDSPIFILNGTGAADDSCGDLALTHWRMAMAWPGSRLDDPRGFGFGWRRASAIDNSSRCCRVGHSLHDPDGLCWRVARCL